MAFLALFQNEDTHRLIPAKYSSEGSVLSTLGLPDEVLGDLSTLDAATNERKLAEQGGNPSIGPSELLMGVPEAHVINAAFCHPGPAGARFNGPRRGAWYASADLVTSAAEVAHHKRLFLKDTRWREPVTFEYRDFLAAFDGMFHQLEPTEMEACLKPAPVPNCYAAGQALAANLLQAGSLGIVYPSVRNPGGTCIACFRPALVFRPRRGELYKITVQADSPNAISIEVVPRTS